MRVRCCSDEGKVFLRIQQEQAQKEIDITNTDSLLDMTDFLPGRITFTMVNEDGRNVDFELEWREACHEKIQYYNIFIINDHTVMFLCFR